MSDDAQLLRVPMVRFERWLPGPLEHIWEFLTDTALLPGWYGEGTIEPHPGGLVHLHGGRVCGYVTQWMPPRRLAYTWNVFLPEEDVSPYPESYLTLTLEPQDDGVLLTLTHVPVLARFEKQNAMGWHTFLDMLHDALSGVPVESRDIYMQRNAARYEVDLQNLVR